MRAGFAALVAVTWLAACSRPCETFDERVCEHLGAERCALWEGPLHKAGSPSQAVGGAHSSGRNLLKGRGWVERLVYGENGRICQNALDHFDEVVKGIEASVDVQDGS